jgi:diguanylate cyclase (GGDEF)-like protein
VNALEGGTVKPSVLPSGGPPSRRPTSVRTTARANGSRGSTPVDPAAGDAADVSGAGGDGPGTGHGPGSEQELQNLLARLASLGDVAYEELLAVPAEHALDRLGATSVALSRWERDRGVLRCLVNVGELPPGDTRFPDSETYDLSEWESVLDLARGSGATFQLDDPDLSLRSRQLLQHYGHRSAVSVPVYVGDRLWGELWATKRTEPLKPDAVEACTRVAAEVSGMIALAERLEHMARLAFQDPLTGLGNRRQLDDALHAFLSDGGPGTTVVVCDVDDLKRVNDENGHDAGDKVITAVADALSSAVAPVAGAVCVRLGGDEFAVLLPGAQRATAIATIEAAARALSTATPPVTVSCGIAVVGAGTSVRDALSVADSAQYSAKRRGALLFVAGPEPTEDRPRRRFRDRPGGSPQAAPSADLHLVAARAVVGVAEALVDAPQTARGRLEWLAERLLAGLQLDHWTLSTVDLDGDRLLAITSMGLRAGRSVEDADADLLVDTALQLADYPLSERAVVGDGWFTIDAEDETADAAEREVLSALGKRYLVALGWSEGSQGLLLELYARGDRDVELLGATTALAAGALLGQPLPRFTGSPQA